MFSDRLSSFPAQMPITTKASAKTQGGSHARWASDFLALLSRPVGALLVLLTAVFVVYAPSLNGQFLWDDRSLVKGNLLIRSPRFAFEVFRHHLFDDESNFYRPTQTLTFLTDYWFFGLNPFGYHLTSILIHAANAFLLCLVLRLVLPRLLAGALDIRQTHWLALGIALVWAVHPVHSAAVAYVSGTADTLAMFFCLSGVLLCERALRAARLLPRLAWGGAAFACLLLGLCAKEIAFVWLLLFCGYLFVLREGTSRRARWSVVAFAGLALIAYLGLRQLPPPATPPPPLPPLPPKAVLMLRALGDYGNLLLFPSRLFMERQVFAAPGLANARSPLFYHALAFGGLLMLAAFALGAWWPGRGRTLRRAGALWFLVGFLPISNLFALNASVAEHWLYLPSIGFLLFLTGVGIDAWPHVRRPHVGAFLLVVLALGIVALGGRTWLRTFDWMDELSFFRQTIADGGDVPRARAGLAVAYGRQAIGGEAEGADDRAIAVLREVVRQYPNVLADRINLGNCLARQGHLAEAKSILEAVADELLTRKGNGAREIVTTLKSLDVLEAGNAGWPERRQTLLVRGLQRNPHSWELVKYGMVQAQRDHRTDAALTLVWRFAVAHWWHAPAHVALGALQAEAGHPAAALATWEDAASLDVHDAEPFSDAAALFLREDRLTEAHHFQARAVDREPDSIRQHAFFAQILEREGNAEAARREVAIAKSLVAQTEGKR